MKFHYNNIKKSAKKKKDNFCEDSNYKIIYNI